MLTQDFGNSETTARDGPKYNGGPENGNVDIDRVALPVLSCKLCY
jgi:hypothetical protein